MNAQQARRALDYLVGFNLSPLLWKKIRRGLSAGPRAEPGAAPHRRARARDREVQDARSTGRSISTAHKDKRRLHRQAHPFQAARSSTSSRSATPSARPRSARFLEEHGKGTAKVKEVETKSKLRSPAAPFTTSTLQQEAVRKLGFSTDRAMKVAQSLYEGVTVGQGRDRPHHLHAHRLGHALQGSDDRDARLHHQELRRRTTCRRRRSMYRSKSKNAQEAHEAIRPDVDRAHARSVVAVPERRAAQALRDDLEARDRLADDAGASSTPSRWTSPSGGAGNVFRATGQTMVFPGFYAVYHEDQDDAVEEEDKRLPAVRDGRRGEDRQALRRAALHPAAAALLRGEPGEGARAVRHRPAVDLRLDHLDAAEPRVRDARQEALHAHRRGPRREQVPHRALRPLGRLRVHRQAGGRARRHLQRQGGVGAGAASGSGRISPRRSARRSRCRART